MGLGAQNRAMAMSKRFRLSVHVALTLISFGPAEPLGSLPLAPVIWLPLRRGPVRSLRQFF